MEDEARRCADAMYYHAEESNNIQALGQQGAGGEGQAGARQGRAGGTEAEEEEAGGGIPERNDFSALDCPGAAGFPAGACGARLAAPSVVIPAALQLPSALVWGGESSASDPAARSALRNVNVNNELTPRPAPSPGPRRRV